MREKLSDLVPDELESLPWNPSSAAESLDKLYQRVDLEASRTIRWYYARRHGPAIAARIVRWLAILSTAVGGLYPIWSRLLPGTADSYKDLGYPLLALAAALIAIDRFGGISSAWMRCIMTAQTLAHEQRVFRLDWSQQRAVLAAGAQPPTLQQLLPLFERIRAFALKHDEIVETETRTWIAEFRSVLAELG